MELRGLTYFVAVAEELHFGRAAERLHIAQPAVSQQIARLERDLGVRLFARSSRVVQLTGAGTVLLERARQVLAEADGLRAVAAELVGASRGVLRVGSSANMGWRLQRVLLEFASTLPGVDVSVVASHTAAKLDALRERRLEVAFVRMTGDAPGVLLLPLWREPLLLVLPERHPLAARSSVPLAALAGMPVMLSPREVSAGLHDMFLTRCREAGFEPVLGPPHQSTGDTLATIVASADTWSPMHAAHDALLDHGRTVGVAVRTFEDLDVQAVCSLAWSAVDPDPATLAFVAAARRLRVDGAFEVAPSRTDLSTTSS